MCFPLAAGEFLRVRWAEPLRFKQWSALESLLPLKLLLILAMMDSVKNLLSVGFYNLIRWDILPFVAASTFIIMQTLKWGKRVILIPAVVIVLQVAIELLKPTLYDLVISTPARVGDFTSSGLSSFAMISSLILVISILHYLCSGLSRKIQFGIFATSAFLFSFFHLQYWSAVPTYGASIYNLPFLALTSLSGIGGHIWSLTPWLWLPVVGFLFRHYLEENPNRQMSVRLKYTLDLFLTAYFVFYFVKLYPDYYSKFDARYLFSSRIFVATIWDILGLISLYWILRRICEFAALWIPLPQLLLRLISSGAVIFYMTHYLIAYWTVHTWALLIKNALLSYWLYASFVGFVSVGISSLLVALYQGKVLFFVKKV